MNMKRLITLIFAGTFFIAACGMEAAKTAPSPEPVMEEAAKPAVEEAAEPAVEEATEPAPEAEEEPAEPETPEE